MSRLRNMTGEGDDNVGSVLMGTTPVFLMKDRKLFLFFFSRARYKKKLEECGWGRGGEKLVELPRLIPEINLTQKFPR